MKKAFLIACLLIGIVGSASAQRDDLYFIPKKKKAAVSEKADVESAQRAGEQAVQSDDNTSSATDVPAKGLMIDEDAYNRRGSYLTEEGDAVSAFAMDDEGFVVITEEGDTLWMDTDTLRLTRAQDDEGWVNGFEGSDSDYEYAMRIVRFRNPRYAIPVSSPLYWDVVYGGALWPSWEWNIYNDGMYAYVFPTSSNWYYWDYMMSYPFGWSAWNHHWPYHYGYHWGHHWGGHYGFYGHVWYDPWYNPCFHGYYPGWHHGHHHGFYPGSHAGKPGWGGPKAFPNHRTASVASTRRGSQSDNTAARGSVSTSRRSTASGDAVTRRGDGGSTRNSAIRVVTGRSGDASRSSGTVRSSQSSRTGRNDEVVRRSTGSSSVSRSATSGGSSRGTYTRQSSSRSSSGSSYNRPSSTRSTSSVSRSSSSSSSRSSSYSSGSSSSRSSGSSSSYSSGSSSRSSSYSSGSSYSGGSRNGGSYSSGSRSGGGSRR